MAHGQEKKKKASHCKRQILYPSINSAEITAVYLVGCICVLKKKGGETILITVIFLINNAMLAFQSSWGGQWELCSKPCLSFYSGIPACSLDHNTPGIA